MEPVTLASALIQGSTGAKMTGFSFPALFQLLERKQGLSTAVPGLQQLKYMKRCTRCLVEQDYTNFDTFQKRGRSYLRANCKPCALQLLREWRHKNRERLLKKSADYYAIHKDSFKKYKKVYRSSPDIKFKDALFRHRRRVRLASAQDKGNATISEMKLLLKDAIECRKCERLFNKKLRPTLDHIIPISKGGSNALDNLQVLCLSCNARKGNKVF